MKNRREENTTATPFVLRDIIATPTQNLPSSLQKKNLERDDTTQINKRREDEVHNKNYFYSPPWGSSCLILQQQQCYSTCGRIIWILPNNLRRLCPPPTRKFLSRRNLCCSGGREPEAYSLLNSFGRWKVCHSYCWQRRGRRWSLSPDVSVYRSPRSAFCYAHPGEGSSEYKRYLVLFTCYEYGHSDPGLSIVITY